MGIATRCAPSVDEKAEKVALPVVYAFLSDKTQESYQAVLRAVKDAVREQGIPAQNPETIVTDFEHSIKKNSNIRLSVSQRALLFFFHLGQSLY